MTCALDTNVVVRVLADPHSSQLAAAEQLLQSRFTVPISVFMETEWVLRSVYGWKRAGIAAAFRDLVDLPGLVSAPPAIDWILERYETGADFADMVHLTSSGDASTFATFDADLARCAGANTPLPIETLA